MDLDATALPPPPRPLSTFVASLTNDRYRDRTGRGGGVEKKYLKLNLYKQLRQPRNRSRHIVFRRRRDTPLIQFSMTNDTLRHPSGHDW